MATSTPTAPESSVGTRERIVAATNELFRRQGYNGTSLAQIVKAAGATTGSVYHFFPGGKDELTAEVLRTSGRSYGDLVEAIVRAAGSPAVGVSDAFVGAAAVMVESDYIDPCPIGTVAREVASSHDELRAVAAEVMDSWIERLARVFLDCGVAGARATELAALMVAAIEGGFVLARTTRSVDAFVAIGESIAALVATELAEAAQTVER